MKLITNAGDTFEELIQTYGNADDDASVRNASFQLATLNGWNGDFNGKLSPLFEIPEGTLITIPDTMLRDVWKGKDSPGTSISIKGGGTTKVNWWALAGIGILIIVTLKSRVQK